jgi:hypothetical protein
MTPNPRRWIQRLHRRVSENPKDVPGLSHIPSAATYIGHLQSQQILGTKLSLHWTLANTDNPGQKIVLILHTCKHRESWSETVMHTHCFSHSCRFTYSVSTVLQKHHTLKQQQRTPSSAKTSGWVVCVPWWLLSGISRNPGLGFSLRPAVSGLGWFSWSEGGHIFISSCYIASFVRSLRESEPVWMSWSVHSTLRCIHSLRNMEGD